MSSGIALTKFIYPLETPIVISSELGLKLDNPRTEKEIELIRNFITPSIEAENEQYHATKRFPVLTRIMLNLDYLKKYLSSLPQENYAYSFFKDNEKATPIDLIAKSWIFVRFDTIIDVDEILNTKHYIELLSLAKEEKEDYLNKLTEVFSYSYIVSLLTFYDEQTPYMGDSFMLTIPHPFYMFFPSVNQWVIETLDRFSDNMSMLNPSFKKPMFNDYWWLADKEKLLNWTSKIENFIQLRCKRVQNKKVSVSQKQSPKDKLLHIGGRLKIAYEHMNQPEFPLLLLVGNIEYLLTRNPDTNKFNVEDSISRQFKLKCGVAINMADSEIPLEGLYEELSHIYSLRSDFAHGNCNGKCDKNKLYKVVSDLFRYTRLILIAYMNNKSLIEYLKDN